MLELREYQKKGIDQIASLAGSGVRRIIFQAPTGAGKTVLFVALCERFLASYDSTIYICVHRQELLTQTVNTIKKVIGIKPGVVVAGAQVVIHLDSRVPYPNAKIVVCMIESFYSRLRRGLIDVKGKGLLIVDEAHRAEFRKIYRFFDRYLIVGFTATPISANKKHPLTIDFDDIVAPVRIKDLQEMGFLAKNTTITIKDAIDRNKLKITRGGDFDLRLMGKMYGQTKHIVNCRKAYEKYSIGEKTLIYNCNIHHSRLVTEEFIMSGYNARDLDGTHSDEYRKDTIKWFHETPDAILCSVDILTTGFDEPRVQTVIFNRATTSLVLWLQACGRGSRVDKETNKHNFKIIDLGANVASHLDWAYPHDWKYVFKNPEEYRTGKGVAPVKNCVECDALVHLSVKICPYCLSNIAKDVQYDMEDIEFEKVTGDINIYAIDNWNKYSPYRTLHIVKGKLVTQFRKYYHGNIISENTKHELNKRYQVYVKAWCNKNNKPYNKWHKETTKQWLFDELDRVYQQ